MAIAGVFVSRLMADQEIPRGQGRSGEGSVELAGYLRRGCTQSLGSRAAKGRVPRAKARNVSLC
jgi:hypothetical protein